MIDQRLKIKSQQEKLATKLNQGKTAYLGWSVICQNLMAI